MIFRNRKDTPVNEEFNGIKKNKLDKSCMLNLDNIEVFQEVPTKDINLPPKLNRDMLDLLLAYSEAEKRILKLPTS